MQRACLLDALIVGYDVLKSGGTAIVAVEEAIRILERCHCSIAGLGARLQLDGARRMDASIMEDVRS